MTADSGPDLIPLARPPIFTLSAFGDEVADDLETQLDVLAAEDVHHLELRGAWGHNVLDLDPRALAHAAGLLRARGFAVSAIASPVGKSSLIRRRVHELARLDRAIAAAEALNTRFIRIFSFYVRRATATRQRAAVVDRLGALTDRAARAGMTLLLENESRLYGDTPDRCLDLLRTIASSALRFAFDPANFVQTGVRPMAEAWPLLADYVAHVHIKDAVFATGAVRPAGEGDGEIPALLQALAARGYQGFLTLEPHLQVAGPNGGFSGPDGLRAASRALRRLLADLPADVTFQ
ncbi:MAG TPA: sugar phosphate isomerase/epimerase family protein [Ktedonobacterales bacterium]